MQPRVLSAKHGTRNTELYWVVKVLNVLMISYLYHQERE
jgi:hypothetical protein